MKNKCLLLAIYGLFVCSLSFGQDSILRLGVIVDCRTANSNLLTEGVLKEVRTLLKSNFEVILENKDILYSDCNVDMAKSNLDLLLQDDRIDIILGVDAIGSHVIASNGPYKKPALACITINPQVQKLPLSKKGTSGVKNLSYIVLPYSPQRDLEVFQDMVDFKNIGIILDEATFNSIPSLPQFLVSSLNSLGTKHKFIFAKSDIDAMLNDITNDLDAIYYLPSDQLTLESQKKLIEGVNNKGIPSFSLLGRSDVQSGVLAGIAPKSNAGRLIRRIALNIQRMANGENAGNMAVALSQKEELVINMATARQIDYSPDWDILSEALQINELREDVDRRVNIYSVIAEGLEKNLDIVIAKKDVAFSREEVNVAKSASLPQLDVSASHSLLDNNTAVISNGQNPQHKGNASSSLSQVIYSEQVSANRDIQQILLRGVEASLQAQSLDIIFDVSNAYLGLLRTKTAEKIQKQNLELTRKNLELARVSNSIGESGPSDLYRWQSEISTAKANLLNATAQRIQAELALNQLVYRPINEPFITEEVDITDPRLVINDQRVGKYINNPRDFYVYADFLVEETMRNLPTLRKLSFDISAQERSRTLARRNLYAPTIALSGGTNYELYRGGAGTEIPVEFGSPNDLNWSLGVGASLPIFTGGQRKAQYQQAKIQTEILNTTKENLERQFEQQTRSALENVRASFRNIELTKDAELAASKNFELIQDSYSKGAVTITQLLDAQNAAISAQLNSANAVYIFMIDMFGMGRSTGQYYVLFTEEQKVDYAARLKEYYESK
jgi:outer membrane protein TolC